MRGGSPYLAGVGSQGPLSIRFSLFRNYFRPRRCQPLEKPSEGGGFDLKPRRIMPHPYLQSLMRRNALRLSWRRQPARHFHGAGEGYHASFVRTGGGPQDPRCHPPKLQHAEGTGRVGPLNSLDDEIRPAHRGDRVPSSNFHLIARAHQHPRHRHPNLPRREVHHVTNPLGHCLPAQLYPRELSERHRRLAVKQDPGRAALARVNDVVPVEGVVEPEGPGSPLKSCHRHLSRDQGDGARASPGLRLGGPGGHCPHQGRYQGYQQQPLNSSHSRSLRGSDRRPGLSLALPALPSLLTDQANREGDLKARKEPSSLHASHFPQRASCNLLIYFVAIKISPPAGDQNGSVSARMTP